MAKLFLSYARENATTAERLADALERGGEHDVWWDRDLTGGANFASEIEQQLRDCDIVIVLWSPAAVQSPWVRDEATIGRDAGKLLPISIDGAEPPIGFRQFHAVDLSAGRLSKAAVANVRDAVARLIHAPDAPSLPARAPQPHRLPMRLAGGIVALLLILGVATYFLLGRTSASAHSVAIVSASDSPTSRDYAQSIATDMAVFLPAHAHDASVVEADRAEDAGYRFRVSVLSKSRAIDARLWLSARREAGILWSKSWTGIDPNTTDLKKQMSLAASQALGCVFEASEGRGQLNSRLLAMYVSGCVALNDLPKSPELLIDVFSKITSDAPDHAPAWADLAIAYAAHADDLLTQNKPIPPDLRKRAMAASNEALRLNPKSGKALMAQAIFATERRIERVALLEKAVQLEPKSAILRRELSGLLQLVGRMNDSEEEARRAVELDPLSPETRGSYIVALTRAGRFTEARDVLAEAEKIWPHSGAIGQTAFGYHLRYGDPRRAERLAEIFVPEGEAEHPALLKYLEARRTGSAGNQAEALARYRALDLSDYWGPYLLALATFGKFEEAFRLFDQVDELGDFYTDILFRPQFQPLREDPRFMGLADRLGLIRYWHASGHWPDFCSDRKLPYDCKAEAAKYLR